MRVVLASSCPQEEEKRTGLGNYARSLRWALREAGVDCPAAVEGVGNRPDIVHLLAPQVPPAVAPGVPLVLTVHDLAWRRFPADYYPNAVRYFEQTLGEGGRSGLKKPVSTPIGTG